MKYKLLVFLSTFFIGHLFAQLTTTSTSNSSTTTTTTLVEEETVETVQSAVAAQGVFKSRNGSSCLYGGFYSEMKGDICTHPLNLEDSEAKERYIKSCKEIFKANGQEDTDSKCETDINFNVCNPSLFGTKRSSEFFKNQNAGAAGDLSTYTSLSCYIDTHREYIAKQSMDSVIENLKEKEHLDEFLQIMQDTLQFCLCGNNQQELSGKYGVKIEETNTCDSLLFRLRKVLGGYFCSLDSDDRLNDLSQFIIGLDQEVLGKYEDELMEKMQETIDGNSAESFSKYLEEYKDYVGYNDNPKQSNKDLKRKENYSFLSEWENEWEAKYCEAPPKPQVKCLNFEVQSVPGEKQYELTPVLTIDESCDNKIEDYEIFYIDQSPKEEEEEEETETETSTTTTSSSSTTSTTLEEKEKELEREGIKTANESPTNFDRKKETYPVLYKVYKKGTDEVVAEDSVDVLKIGDCTDNGIKMNIENTCLPSPGLKQTCKVTITFNANCEDSELEEITEHNVKWEGPEVKKFIAGEDKNSGTMDPDKEKSFKRAQNKSYPVEIKAAVKYKLKDDPEEKSEDLSGNTQIPILNFGPAGSGPKLKLSIDAN